MRPSLFRAKLLLCSRPPWQNWLSHSAQITQIYHVFNVLLATGSVCQVHVWRTQVQKMSKIIENWWEHFLHHWGVNRMACISTLAAKACRTTCCKWHQITLSPSHLQTRLLHGANPNLEQPGATLTPYRSPSWNEARNNNSIGQAYACVILRDRFDHSPTWDFTNPTSWSSVVSSQHALDSAS